MRRESTPHPIRRLLLTAALFGGGVAVASTLRPSVIVHGEIRDGYGIRLHGGAEVSIYYDGEETDRTVAGAYPDRLSYRLVMDVHDPLTAAPGQVIPGVLVEIRVRQGTTDQPVLGSHTFTVPGDGSPVRVDLVLGEDTDGDGLPDAWEQIVIANSGGLATTLQDVGPGRDLDGDGMNDDQEFWYGSFAFLAGDELRVDSFARSGNRYALTLLTTPQAVYTIECTADLAEPAVPWTPCSIALQEAAATAPTGFAGDGGFATVYIEDAGPNAHYRLRAE